jgi:hypothetical protein
MLKTKMASVRERTPVYIAPATRPQGVEEQQDFYLLAQSHSSNKLAKQLTKHIADTAQFDFYGNGTIIDKDFKLFIKGYRELVNGVNQSAAMLLDSLMIAATQNGLQSTLITLPLREYMEMRELKDEKEIRAQVKRDIDSLERISFEYRGIGKQRGAWLKVSIAGGTVGQIKNGDIIFRFNQDFFDSFRTGNYKYIYMYFPREALRGNIKQHPHKYWLARKIAEHKRMNLGKPNEDIISVRTLINACPHFPSYTKRVTERMITPFERDMDELNESLSWHYTDMEEGPKDYQAFINATVTINWRYYPTMQGIEDGKAKKARKTALKKDSSK